MEGGFDWKMFSQLIKKVLDFKTKTSFTYVNADAWEEVLYFSLKKMGEKAEWTLGSHAKGADIKTERFAISAKSGKIKKGRLELSSYRLTRFDDAGKMDVKRMAGFIDDERNYEFYLCCARVNAAGGARRYVVFKVPADILVAKSAEWKEVKDRKGELSKYACNAENGVCAEIRKKMSNQLWLSVPLGLCEKNLEVEYSKDEIGAEFDKVFR